MRAPRGLVLRLAVLATALVVGPATLAPGTAQAPGDLGAAAAQARKADGGSAAKVYGWGVMQWDFAWEFGESLSSGAYRGQAFQGGSWTDHSTGTGRVVKLGGGLEFHSGEVTRAFKAPDRGTTTLELDDKAAKRGRWELNEGIQFWDDQDAPGGESYTFLVELIPDDPASYDCGRHNITIARSEVGSSKVRVQANAGSTQWGKTIGGFGRGSDPKKPDDRTYSLQITGKRITWFVNGKAVASLGAKAAIPKIPMTMRLSLVGKGSAEMRKTDVLVDWVRGYNLKRGKRAPKGMALQKGKYGGDC